MIKSKDDPALRQVKVMMGSRSSPATGKNSKLKGKTEKTAYSYTVEISGLQENNGDQLTRAVPRRPETALGNLSSRWKLPRPVWPGAGKRGLLHHRLST
jgi:hypothetical protein